MGLKEKKFLETFEKTYGQGSLVLANDVAPYEVISTGSLTLDYVLGVGGLVEGRLVEMWGPESIGKTSLSLLMLAEAQKKHKKQVAFIDVEQKFDKPWAIAHGVNVQDLYLYTPESAEDVADALKDMVRSGLFSMVVLDSVGAMIPEREKEKNAEDAVMAMQAKIITRMVKIAAVEARKTSTVVVMLNQVRANLSYGASTTTGGGFALRHCTTMKFKLKRTGTNPYKVKLLGEDRIVGHEIAVYVERNGVAPAYRTAVLSLIHVGSDQYGPIGVDQADEATTLGIKLGIIVQSGAWFTLPDGERLQGRDKVVAALRENSKMVEDIRTQAIATRLDEITQEDDFEESKGPKFRKGMDHVEPAQIEIPDGS